MRDPRNLLIKTLDGDWSDKDIVMLHACFELLTNFVEDELPLDDRDWEHDEKARNARKEITDLYGWWKERIVKEEAGEINPIMRTDEYEIDNQMLIRLINIRKYLWT